MKRRLALLSVWALVLAAPAFAQHKDLAQVDVRLGVPNFGPLITGEFCADPAAPITEVGFPGLSVTQNVVSASTITDLRVGIEVTHTWVGDISMRLTHDTTTTNVLFFDRPGSGGGAAFGCAGDDVDVTIFDTATGGAVETTCAAAVPSIAGEKTPNNPLAAFDGEPLGGVWILNVVDHAAGDVGSLDRWCLSEPQNGGTGGATGGTTGGTGTPATGMRGVALLIALFLGVATFCLRRRGTSHA